MPKVGMAPIRRRQLIDAAIAAIHEYGLADATVARIAHKAGVSAGIVHHYFDGKNDLLFAAMRSLLEDLRVEAVRRLTAAHTPRERSYAIIDACFADDQFSEAVMTAWLALYGSARHSERITRILRIYARRLQSNLTATLLPLLGRGEAERVAEGTAAMIDGLWLQYALKGGVDPAHPRQVTRDYVDAQLAVKAGVRA